LPSRFGFDQLNDRQGFAVAAFDSYESGQLYIIRNDWYSDLNNLNRELLELILSGEKSEPVFVANQSVSKQEYIKSAEKLIAKLQSGKLKKVVLSRVIHEKLSPNFNADLFFNMLAEMYPDAFVYLFHLPGAGTWTGATPETLFSIDAQRAETVSLAGTQPASQINWTKKERDEQQIVTDYIADILKAERIEIYTLRGPEAVFAGNVAHLKTRFLFPPELVQGRTGSLIAKLHPTPAVCGLEKDEAYRIIKETEAHERRFYTGFLGPVNLEGKTDLFVNLRCAELGKDEMNIYVGGGLTKDSVAGNEWEETVRKAKTMLSVAEKIKTFVA
jgi:isochorismate synthase